MSAIEIRGVTTQFGAVMAVNDLTLDVPEGSIYGFMGPNGSGTTTTIRMIMNIILSDSGEIRVLGRQSAVSAADDVGYLPEERSLYKKMAVRRLLRWIRA
jgi:ABC-2 type transport system ATP-binding protein